MPAPLDLDTFKGIIPRADATALPANAAVIAENIDFSTGKLQSLKADFKLRDLALAAQSVFSTDGLRFYAWASDVDAVQSPLQSGTSNDLLYYTTGSDFRVTRISLAPVNGAAPTSSYRVGVPRPSAAARITVVHPTPPAAPVATVEPLPADTYDARLKAAQAASDATFSASVKTTTETRAYVYTYANTYNEEGPPSDPVTVDVKAQTVNGITTYSTVTVEVTFDGNGEYVPINAARLYRAGTSDQYLFVLSISGSGGKQTAVDAVLGGALNEPLSNIDAYPPPVNLKGLINVGNGILAAWKGRELWFSDAYRPWSWPPAYMKTVGYTIVGALPNSTGAVVTTVGKPSIFTGTSPDAMQEIPLDIDQPGVSKWAMCMLNGSAVYASRDGIVGIAGLQPDMSLSERFFTRKEWRARYGASLGTMQFAYYDGQLVVFSRTGAFTAFMVQLEESAGAMTELPDWKGTSAAVVVTSDQLYTLNGTGLYQFGGGADLPLHWRSADIVLPGPTVLAWAQVECIGDFTVQFYQDGDLGYTEQLSTGTTNFRLPSGAIPGHAGLEPSDRWQIDISGQGTFKWLKAASSARGLAGA
jgi:hypothetical protein